MRFVVRLLLLCALASHAAGWARERLNADTLAQFGGTYSVACGNPSMARLRVTADALMVEMGNQRMTGSDPQAAYSYFGQSPPKDFQVALLSQVRGMSELMFMVFRDRVGNYVELDGAANVRAALGPSLTGRRYRQCDGPAMAGAGAAPDPAEARIYALIHRVNRDTLVGDPPAAMVGELRRLWQGAFRQSR
jgi:hypothetical protein